VVEHVSHELVPVLLVELVLEYGLVGLAFKQERTEEVRAIYILKVSIPQA